MITKVQECVKVLTAFDDKRLSVRPIQMVWKDTAYRLGPVDFLRATKNGSERIYHFSLCDHSGGTYLRLAFHSHSMLWMLEEVDDEPSS